MKKFISGFLSLVFCFSISAGAIENLDFITDNKNDFIHISTDKMTVNNSSDENLQALGELSGDNTSTMSLSGNAIDIPSNLIISLDIQDTADKDSKKCTAGGSFSIGLSSHDFSVEGYLNVITIENGDIVYLGGLYGTMGDSENALESITMNLCYNKTTEEYFIPFCIGTYGLDNAVPVLVEFGQVFDGLTEATKALNSVTSTSDVDKEGFNSKERAIDAGYYLNSYQATKYYNKPVLFSSVYGSKEAIQSGQWRATVRAQVNLQNFKSAYDANLRPSYILASHNHKVRYTWLTFNANDKANRISGVYPENQSYSINVKLPTFVIPAAKYTGAVNYLASYFNVSIPVNSVKNEYSNNLSKVVAELYNSGGYKNIVTTKTDALSAAKEEKTGISTDMLVLNGSGSVNAYYQTKVQISFDEVSGEGAEYPRDVPVTSSATAYYLKSVG